MAMNKNPVRQKALQKLLKASTCPPQDMAVTNHWLSDRKKETGTGVKLCWDKRGYLIGMCLRGVALPSVVSLREFPELRYLILEDNGGMVKLDITKNTNLETLVIKSPLLTELDVSQNPALSELEVCHTHLFSLSLCDNSALTTLVLYDTMLNALDVSGQPNLTRLMTDISPLMMVALSPSLREVSLAGTLIARLIVPEGSHLDYLDISGTKTLQALQLDKAANITRLRLRHTGVQNLALRGLPLQELDCSYSPVSYLDITDCKKLMLLDVTNTKLKKLAFSGVEQLRIFYAEGAPLSGCTLPDSVTVVRPL